MRYKRLLLGTVIGSAVFLGLLIAVTPLIAVQYLQFWLREQGAVGATVQDVDFNPFTGRLTVSGLQATGASGEELELNHLAAKLRWQPLFSRRLYIESLRVEGARAAILLDKQGMVRVGGLTFPGSRHSGPEDSGPEWGFGSEKIELRNIHLRYRDGSLATGLDIHALDLGSQFTWREDEATDLSLDVTLDGATLSLRGTTQPWAREPGLTGRLTIDGLRLSRYAQMLESLTGLREPRGTLRGEIALNGYRRNGSLDWQADGTLSLEEGAVSRDAFHIEGDALRWSGKISTQQSTAEAVRLSTKSTLVISGLSIRDQQHSLATRLQALDWEGEIQLTPGENFAEAPRMDGVMRFTLDGFALVHTGLEITLADVSRLEVGELTINSLPSARLDNLRMQETRLLADPASMQSTTAPMVKIGTIQAQQVVYEHPRLTVEKVLLDQPVLTLRRTQDGDLEGVARVQNALRASGDSMPPTASSALPATPRDPGEPLQIVLGELQVNGQDWLDFEDRSVNPAARFHLTRLHVLARNLRSHGAEPVELTLQAEDKTTGLRINGTVTPPGTDPDQVFSAELQAHLRALELPQLSPYVPDYELTRGRLHSDSQIRINDNQISARNKLRIEKLRIKATRRDAAGYDRAEENLPLDVALDMLRNRDDEIHLDVPVSGNWRDPKFGTGDIVRTATRKALQKTALSYAAAALQPLGTILLVRDIAGKTIRPRFEPVAMSPGEASIPAPGEKYLDKLAGMLNSRPKLALTLCGIATAADTTLGGLATESAETPSPGQTATTDNAENRVTPDHSALQALAARRSTSVVEYLVENHAVSRDRLFRCRERVEPDSDAPPRVEIML